MAAGIVVAAIALHARTFAIIGVLAESAAVSAIVVILYTVILRWADNKQAATDYAALYGFSRLASTIVLLVVPQLLPLLGFLVIVFSIEANCCRQRIWAWRWRAGGWWSATCRPGSSSVPSPMRRARCPGPIGSSWRPIFDWLRAEGRVAGHVNPLPSDE